MKIGDLTKEEIDKICSKYSLCYQNGGCPFEDEENHLCMVTKTNKSKYLEVEVEVEE